MAIRTFFICSVVIILGASQGRCGGNMPVYNPDIYSANHLKVGVERAQEDEFISCRDEIFSEMLCVPREQFSCLIETYIIGCKEWKKDAGKGCVLP